MRPSYDLTIDGEQKIVFVVDLDRPGCRSMTNDAENVVADGHAMVSPFWKSSYPPIRKLALRRPIERRHI